MLIKVIDTGEGFSSEQQQDLFTPFNRLGREQGEIQGTGIGLVICKELIEKMGGQIGVKSELNTGSEFWIKLPLVKG
jgi:signal transduction histidine kinase